MQVYCFLAYWTCSAWTSCFHELLGPKMDPLEIAFRNIINDFQFNMNILSKEMYRL